MSEKIPECGRFTTRTAAISDGENRERGKIIFKDMKEKLS